MCNYSSNTLASILSVIMLTFLVNRINNLFTCAGIHACTNTPRAILILGTSTRNYCRVIKTAPLKGTITVQMLSKILILPPTHT